MQTSLYVDSFGINLLHLCKRTLLIYMSTSRYLAEKIKDCDWALVQNTRVDILPMSLKNRHERQEKCTEGCKVEL